MRLRCAAAAAFVAASLGAASIHATQRSSGTECISIDRSAAGAGVWPRAGAGTSRFDLQGHRGARALAPENTLAGIDAALAIGIDTLELDAAMTRDGVVVLTHDRRLNPDITRDARGDWLTAPGPAIRSLDFAQLQHFDVGRIRPGSSYAAQFPDQVPVDGSRIPSLAEVFRHVAAHHDPRIRFNLEIKTSPLAPDDTVEPDVFAAALVAVIREHRMTGRSMIQSFDWRGLVEVQRIAPEIPTVYLTSQRPGFDTVQLRNPHGSPWTAGFVAAQYCAVPTVVRAANGAAWSPAQGDLAAGQVRDAQAIGLRVIPWTVNDRDTMLRLIEWGVDGIITDKPDLLRQVMAERGMPLPPPSVPRR